MDRFKIFLKITSVVLTACLVLISAFGVGIEALFGKAALLSFMVAAPDGVHSIYNKSIDVAPENTQDAQGTVTDRFVEVPNTNTEGTVSESTTVAVEQKVMGNIIKKTLSPYSANTHYDCVYVKNTSGAKVDIASDLESKLDFELNKSQEPEILIYHTHTTEGFMNSESEYYTDHDEPRTTDTEKNIAKIGEVIAERLRKAGYSVVHDKTLHDHPGFSGSYNRSADTVKTILEKYPTIKIAIDVHRDSILSGKSDRIAPVVSVNGKEAAQVMLVMGSETGSIENYPDWRQNFKFAAKLQYTFESTYPQFARAMLLRSAKYNQNLTKGSILIEVGSDANTMEQALYSAELVGRSLATLLNSQ